MRIIIEKDILINQRKCFSENSSINTDFFWKDFLDTLNEYSIWHEICDDQIKIFAQRISLEEIQMNDLLGFLDDVTDFRLDYITQGFGLDTQFLLRTDTK